MEFSINRILLLVRREWIKNGRKIIIGISSAVGLALIFSILGVFDGGINAAYYSYPVSVFFIVGGAIIFSASFTEWDKTETGYQILTLPASNLEKLTSSWLVGFLIYTVLSAVFISLGYAILAILDASGLNVIGEYMDASWVIKLLSTHLLVQMFCLYRVLYHK